MKEPNYSYKIKQILKVIDGDTVDVLVDLGFHISVKKRVRLFGINAPEVRTRDLIEKEKGKLSKAKLEELLKKEHPEEDGVLILKCHGLGKYGRVIGTLYNGNCDLNRTMVLEGHASAYEFSK